MNLLQINYFMEVCKTKSFTTASKNLYVSQSSVSRQIQQLEEELDAKLILRDKSGLSLTPAGKIFYERFQLIMCDIATTIEQVKKAADPKKVIRIGIFQPLNQSAIDDMMEKLKRNLPDYELMIFRCKVPELQELFQQEKLDVVFCIDGIEFAKSDVHKSVFLKKQAGLICSKIFEKNCGGKLELESFQHKKLICIDEKNAPGLSQAQARAVQNMGIEIEEVIHTGDILAAVCYSYPEDGYAFYPVDIGVKQKEIISALPLENLAYSLCVYWKDEAFSFLNMNE